MNPRWLLLWSMVGCTTHPSSTSADPTSPPPPRLVATDATLVSEAPKLTMHAAQATVSDAGVATARTVEAQTDTFEIVSKRSQLRFQERKALFEDEVVARRGDVTLRCDRLVVWFGEGEDIERAEASGDVQLEQRDRQARSRNATLDGPAGTVTLFEGPPTLSSTRGTLRGEVITIWLDDEKVDCKQCQWTLLQRP